jgi:hypothetical protein
MGKRVSQDERPYRPVEEALVRAVMGHQGGADGAEKTDIEGSQRTNGQLSTNRVNESLEDELSARATYDRQVIAQVPPVEKLTREKRVLLTSSEEREIERLVARVAEELGTPIKLSHMLRAYMTLLLHAENEITKRARQTTPLHRPPNGDPIALVRFEQRIAQILSAAFRDAPPLRSGRDMISREREIAIMQ